MVAHVISYDELDGRGLVGRFTKGRFLPDRANAVGVAEYDSHSPQELLALSKITWNPGACPRHSAA